MTTELQPCIAENPFTNLELSDGGADLLDFAGKLATKDRLAGPARPGNGPA
jgi:hypothetical protein